MEKEIEKLGKIFKLSGHEAKLYLAALNFEHAHVTDLARKANIPRTACYEPIKNLLQQGFISAIKIRKRHYYRAVEPGKLKYLLERKQVELKDVIADLERRIDIPERKLAISYFGGDDGIQMAADIWLEEARTKKGKSWETTEVNLKEHGLRQLQDYIDRRVKKGIYGEMIASDYPDNPVIKKVLARDNGELRKSILVDPKKYPFRSAIAVLDDMVMIFTYGSEPFAVLIKNKDVAKTLWSIHEMFWDRYDK